MILHNFDQTRVKLDLTVKIIMQLNKKSRLYNILQYYNEYIFKLFHNILTCNHSLVTQYNKNIEILFIFFILIKMFFFIKKFAYTYINLSYKFIGYKMFPIYQKIYYTYLLFPFPFFFFNTVHLVFGITSMNTYEQYTDIPQQLGTIIFNHDNMIRLIRVIFKYFK